MGGHGSQQLEEFHRDLGGEGSFAGDSRAFGAIAGGDGIFEEEDDGVGIWAGEELFGFAVVEGLHEFSPVFIVARLGRAVNCGEDLAVQGNL